MRRRTWTSLIVAGAGLATAGALAGTASAGLAGTRTCHGLPVTVTASAGLVIGTSGRDVIALTGPATVHAGRGIDVICGSNGADTIDAGAGDDVVVARRGNDVVHGGPGADHLYGEQGDDQLVGGPGRDTLMGGSGSDVVRRGPAVPRGRTAEQQTGDTVLQGRSAVSLYVPPGSLGALVENDMAIGMSWQVPRQQFWTGAMPMVGSAFQPMVANSIAVTPSYGVWVNSESGGNVMPGMQVLPNVVVPSIALGSQAMWFGGAPMQVVAGTPGTIGLFNGIDQQLVAGLQVSTVLNGTPIMQPTAAQPVYGNNLVQFVPPTAVNLFVAQEWEAMANQVVQPLPQPSMLVNLAGGHEVVDVTYAINAGFVQG